MYKFPDLSPARCAVGLLLLLALSAPTLAQDVLYLSDQSRLEGTLTELTHERISMQVNKGGSKVKFTFGADRVLAVVNRRARFVCLDQLWFMPTDKRNQLIEQFRRASEGLSHDLIIRDNPVQVIYGKITAAKGSIVSFKPLNGPVTGVPRADLIGLFYASGKHELIARASVLCDKIDQMGGTFPPATPAAVSPKATPVTAAPAQPRPNQRATPPAAATAAPPTPTAPPVIAPMAAAVGDSTAAVGTSAYSAALRLTDSEYEEYRLQALERVDEFGTLLGVVADKTVEAGQKDKAISEILNLFKPEATIQISSVASGKPPVTLSMQDYLRRLKLLPYTSVSIEWADIQYVQELTQRTDGNYYGKIRGEQRFTGLNEKTGRQYSDITQKDVDVMLTPYTKQTDGLERRKWFVLLGNVGVVATK
ncbi:hypothetical protein ACAW74_04395 [Fibrella sp. WM1]|uniref:hypothetical protein n=1 Tax=Fibrella musci TaxID=3242485 RepID=UPI00351FAAF5